MNAALGLPLPATARLPEWSMQPHRSTVSGLIEVSRDAVSRKLHSCLPSGPVAELVDVATLAHEIRQPLTAIVVSANAGLRFLDRSTPNLEKAIEAFKRIVADGDRAGAVVESVRMSFSNPAQNTTLLDVSELVEECVALAHGDLQKYGIAMRTKTNKHLPHIRGNRVQLQQVLVNLIANAIDAMAAIDEPRNLSVESESYERDSIRVSVADTGNGIRAEHADRIFDPLFTTKTNGMGLGLSICRTIIEAHGGRLWYAANTPHGAILQFTLRVA